MAVLDTTFLIDLSNKEGRSLQALAWLRSAQERLLVPSIAATEYLAGLDSLVSSFRRIREDFELLHSTDDSVLRAAELFAAVRRKGSRPGWNDTLVAAHASLEGTYVVSANKRDFVRLGVPAWDYLNEPAPPS